MGATGCEKREVGGVLQCRSLTLTECVQDDRYHMLFGDDKRDKRRNNKFLELLEQRSIIKIRDSFPRRLQRNA